MKNRITQTCNKYKVLMHKLLMMAALVMARMNSIAYASGTDSASSIMKKVIDIIVGIFPLFGGIFILLGVFTLFMAIKTDQPEKKNTAIMDIAIGAIMLVFKAFVWESISALF